MEEKKVLITGGAGFFGELLKRELLVRGYRCVSLDLEPDLTRHANLTVVQGDIRDRELLERIAGRHRFAAVFHLAAVLAHATGNRNFLWTSNVDGTRNIAELARLHRIPRVIFLSSNCLWGESLHRPVTEEDTPRPVELYGQSKWEAEKILLQHRDSFASIIIRCPTIVDAGRLGLLAILFEFIDEGRRVWVVGGGENRYQFIYAGDLVDACLKSLDYSGTEIFNIGADRVPTFAEMYREVIEQAGTGARVASVPRCLALPLLRFAHWLKLSPLGPYQYKMIAGDFSFDTGKIKRSLNWQPTLTNQEMLFEAYRYYRDNRAEIQRRKDCSPHKRAAGMGILRLLKWLS
jgi:UDP-glucose 4-epimerase